MVNANSLKALDSQVEAQVTLGQIRGEKVALPPLHGQLHDKSGPTRSNQVIFHGSVTIALVSLPP